MTGGKVLDIRTGRAVGMTRDLSETFTNQVLGLLKMEVQFYLVFGPCRHLEVRDLVNSLRNLEGFEVIYDRQMPADCIFIFEGQPAELGFAS